jgi:cysteinyl-tRNA synthetase
LSVLAELAPAANEIALQAAKAKKDPRALAKLQSLAAAALEAIDACCRPMGLLQTPASIFFARTQNRRLQLRGLEATTVEAKVRDRAAARTAKDFTKADTLRAELTTMGIEIQDVPGADKTHWRVLV